MPGQKESNVAAAIRRRIENGSYRQYDRLPSSREMANALGVARNTLRAALRKLEREGLLEIRAGSGTYISARKPEHIPNPILDTAPLELIDARFALEPHICRLCVLQGKREDFDLLESICFRMEAAAENPVEFATSDTDFHKALAAITRNDLLNWLIGQISAVRTLPEWKRMRHLTLNEKIIEQYNMQHRDILQAMRARDADLAASRMKTHLETARVSLMRAAEA